MTKGFNCSSTGPIVETKAGKLRGFQLNDLYHFYGVRYGTAKRFEQPVMVEPWEGVQDALAYGYICHPWSPDSPNGDLLVPHRFWPKSEDCLNLNIWTPSIDPAAKKAVIVWFHGGGMSSGSAIEMLAYDGVNIASHGDVVFVSVNHRLNVFGFLNLAKYGEEYANSVNCGVADLILSLKWVKDNIAAFGGDPDNVTIMGQSGGGKKVMAMMQIPDAHGLVNKAIIMSGTKGYVYQDSAEVADLMVAEAGSVDALKALTPEELLNLARKVTKGERFSWGPIENSWHGPNLFHGANENSKKIPLLVGSCIGESGSFGFSVPGRKNLTKDQVDAMVKDQLGEEPGAKMLDLFYKAYPDHDGFDAIVLDDVCRDTTLQLLDQRAADGSAPTYSYMLGYDFPLDDGKAAWHCSDIPFAFRNIDKVAVCNEAEVGPRLQDQMNNAWLAFAKTGNPNCPDIPQWDPYTVGHEATMVFDVNTEQRINFDKEAVAYHKELGIKAEMPNMLM